MPFDPIENHSRARSALSSIHAGVDSADWTEVVGILDAEWSTLTHESPEELLAVIQSMPHDVIDQAPRFRVAQVALNTWIHRQGIFTRAYGDFVEPNPGDSPIDKLASLTARIGIERSLGRFEESILSTEEAVAYFASLPVDVIPTMSSGLPDFHYHWGMSFELAGRFDEALDEYAESHDWAELTGNRIMQTSSVGGIAFLHALSGRDEEAQRWLAKLPPRDDDAWWTAEAAVQGLLAEALIKVDRLDLAAANDVIAQIDISRSADRWGGYFFVKSLAQMDQGAGQRLSTEMATFLRRLPKAHSRFPVNAEFRAIVRYQHLIALGQSSWALRELAAVDKDDDSQTLLDHIGLSMRARRLLHVGRPEAARRLVSPLLEADDSSPRLFIRALLVAAETDRLGRMDELIQRAIELAIWHSHYAPFASCPAPLRASVAERLEQSGKPQVAARLRATIDVEPSRGVDSLTPRELVVIELALAGLRTSTIAEREHRSLNTVKSQLSSAYRKLGVTNRDQLLQHFQIGA